MAKSSTTTRSTSGSVKRACKRKIRIKSATGSRSTAVRVSHKNNPARWADIRTLYKCASQWTIVELSEETHLEEHHESITRFVVDLLGKDSEFFLPIYCEKVREKSVAVVLFDGYIFVKSTPITDDKINRLKNDHLRGPLTVNKIRQYVSSEEINRYKMALQKKVSDKIPRKGQLVTPRIGTFQNLQGKVLSVDRRKLIARVLFRRATRVVETYISVINLEREPALSIAS